MDLLLTHGYFMRDDPKELQIRKPYAPLGLLYICSHLRSKGFDVDVFDSTFASFDQLLRTIQSCRPSVLGIYANLMTRSNVVRIIAAAKDLGWAVIVGGPEPGAYADEYLHGGADIVVFGEGERTLEELLPVLQHREIAHLRGIDGIAFLHDGVVERTRPRSQIEDLDLQPWPARNAVDIDLYLREWREAHGTGSVSFITARGCPYKCQWCSHQVFGATHRRRSAVKVVDEIEWILKHYNPEMVWAADDVFTIHHGWLRAYAAEMKRRSLRIPFECITRADRMNEEVVSQLAELGCFRVWIGSESGSQRLLDSMQRGVTVEQVQNAIALCKGYGIKTGMFLMWGYEGEEVKDIEDTIEHVKRTDPDVFFTTISYPIKGTPYFESIKSKLVQLKPWAHSSDREVRVSGRRSKSFYAVVDLLLKTEAERARLERKNADVREIDELGQLAHFLRDLLHTKGAEADS